MERLNLEGVKIGRLTFITDAPSKNKKRYALWNCECGEKKVISLNSVLYDRVRSCGCLFKEFSRKRFATHNLRKHPLYGLWSQIVNRCCNLKSVSAINYGARGIGVCQEWRKDFKTFYDWAVSNGWQQGLQIDRIDNNGNYEPGNCRFVSVKINMRNRRNTLFVEHEGERLPLVEVCEKLNLKYHNVWQRINTYKWPLHEALTK